MIEEGGDRRKVRTAHRERRHGMGVDPKAPESKKSPPKLDVLRGSVSVR
jgi:hypothetical protein